MAGLKGVVFDMDDTLYLERDYVRSGFRAVAAEVGGDEAFEFLWGHFLRGTRGNTFDLLAAELGRPLDVPGLIDVYRGHTPAIALIPEYASLFHVLRGRGLRLGLITDGPYLSQQRKAEILGLPDHLDDLVLTGNWGEEFYKPHRRAYEVLSERWELEPNSLAYVGDNPEKDFVAPNQLGWRSIRLRLLEGLHAGKEPADVGFAASVEVGSPRDVLRTLEGW